MINACVNLGSPVLPVLSFTQSPKTVIHRSKSMISPITAPTTMLIIINKGPVVCKEPLTMTSINCMAPLIPSNSTMIPHTTIRVCFKLSFINRPHVSPIILPPIMSPMLITVPKPIIFLSFPLRMKVIMKVVYQLYR